MQTAIGADERAKGRSRNSLSREPDESAGYAEPLVRLSFALLRLRSAEDGTVSCGPDELARLCRIAPMIAISALRQLEEMSGVASEDGRLRVLNPALLADLVGIA